MSYTEIYILGSDGLVDVSDIKDGNRSGMYIWNDIAKRYFGLEMFPLWGGEMATKIWNAWDHFDMPEHDALSLLSTMDKATVSKDNLPCLIEAFKEYGRAHPRSSFSDQALALENFQLKDDEVVAWRQTSVGEFWGIVGFDEDEGLEIYYNPATGTDHFDIVDELRNK